MNAPQKRKVHPRVVELLRLRGGFPGEYTDKEVEDACHGSILSVSCHFAHFIESVLSLFKPLAD